MNLCVLAGRLLTEPKIDYDDNQTPKSAYFRIAVKRSFVMKDNVEQDFFQVLAGRKAQAKYIADYIHKGDKVLMHGRFLNNNYEKDGETVYSFIFQVDSIELCVQSLNNQNSEFYDAQEDIPFNNQEGT